MTKQLGTYQEVLYTQKKFVHTKLVSSIIHGSQKMEMTQMFLH